MVLGCLFARGFFDFFYEFANFVKITWFWDITDCSITPLRNEYILLIKRQLGQSPPICLSLRVHLKGMQNFHCLFQISSLNRKSKIYQWLIQSISNCVIELIYDNICLSICSLNSWDIAFNVVKSDFIWVVDWVPDAEILAVLGYDYFWFGNPFGVGAIVEEGVLLLSFDVIKEKLFSFVTKEEFVSVCV